jgi:hypothetical protein
MQNKENLTALQQLFSDLEKSQPGLFSVYTVDGRNCINQFFKYLEIEKQQIINAFNEGEINSVDYFNPENITIEEAEQYYNETYK